MANTSTLVYSTGTDEDVCDLCRRGLPVTVTKCSCCTRHGRSTFQLCAWCREDTLQRITCAWHGDCC